MTKNSISDLISRIFIVGMVILITSLFLSGIMYVAISSGDTEEITTYPHSLTLRPNGDSGLNDWNTSGIGILHYTFVNETISDSNTTYLKRNIGGHYASESFNMTNHISENGTIVNVTVYSIARKTNNTPMVIGLKIADNRNLTYIKTTDSKQLTTTWDTYSYSFVLDWNDTEWTWEKIDNLSIVNMGEKIDLNYTCLTQVYSIVNYETYTSTTNSNPGIFAILPVMIAIIIISGIIYIWKPDKKRY